MGNFLLFAAGIGAGIIGTKLAWGFIDIFKAAASEDLQGKDDNYGR